VLRLARPRVEHRVNAPRGALNLRLALALGVFGAALCLACSGAHGFTLA
jgi:hypothetical protein